MNNEKIKSYSSDDRWDVLTRESFQKKDRRNHLSQDENALTY